MNRIFRNTLLATLTASAFSLVSAQTLAENPTTPAPKHETQTPEAERNLKVFDTLDSNVFSN